MTKKKENNSSVPKTELEIKQTKTQQKKFHFSRLYIVTAISTAAVCLTIVLISAQVSRSVTHWGEKNPIVLPSPIPVDSLLKGLEKENALPVPERSSAPVATIAPQIPTEQPSAEPIEEKSTKPAAETSDVAAAGLFKKSEPFHISLPLSGEVLNPFSENRLQKSKTLGDWRTHNGVDLKADIGTPVNAAADGTVVRAEYDTMTGYTIVLGHDSKYQTLYANLASVEMVEKGQSIRAGECLGAVGDSAVFEKLENSHLHFELTENGSYQNPMNYVQ